MLKNKTIKLLHEGRILRGEGFACSGMTREGRKTRGEKSIRFLAYAWLVPV